MAVHASLRDVMLTQRCGPWVELSRPRRAVFVSDVDGVYTKPPAQAGAVLLRRLLIRPAQTVGDVLAGVSITAASHDVTGGLVAKVEVNPVLPAARCRWNYPLSRPPLPGRVRWKSCAQSTHSPHAMTRAPLVAPSEVMTRRRAAAPTRKTAAVMPPPRTRPRFAALCLVQVTAS